MENEDAPTISNAKTKHTTTDSSSSTPSYHQRNNPPLPPAKSHEDSPSVSPLSFVQSSPSHGFSPRDDEEFPESPPLHPLETLPPTATVVNRSVREEPPTVVTKSDHPAGDGFVGRVVEERGSAGRRPRPPIMRRENTEAPVKNAALGFRAFGFVSCLISFSVMVADKNQGWALDSSHRYKEFRYCMAVNVIGFVYSGIHVFDLAYHLATGKYVMWHQLRYYLDFALDQILTYLLISASSSAATRVDDWKSNWGSDKFPDMATASVVVSFLAFVALASSSLISGYTLGTLKSA